MGAGKTVTVSGLTLTGAAAGNYTLASTTATTTAAITARDGDADGRWRDKAYDGTTSATLTSCTVSGAGRRRRGGLHRHGGVRDGERGRGQDGDGERPDADGRGRRELHAGEHDGDDDRGDHGRDGDAGGDGGEQGVRRDDERDAHELHGERRWSAATW